MLGVTGIMWSLSAYGPDVDGYGPHVSMTATVRASCLTFIVDGFGPLFRGDAVHVLFSGGWYSARR